MSAPGYRSTDLLPADPSGYVDLRCTCSGLDCLIFGYSIEIQAGASGSVTSRKMKRDDGPETLAYTLYRDLTRLLPWNTGSNAFGGTYLLAQFGVTQRIPVYGRIPAGQVIPAGAYKETPSVAVVY